MTPLTYKGRPQERGVALLVVLLLVTVRSTMAIAMTDDIRFAVRRTANIRMNEQAQWYARGAETLARQVLWRSWKATPMRSTLRDPWAAHGVSFAIDGGSITGRIADAGNCFNLNSVVEAGPKGEYVRRESARENFDRLLIALDIPSDIASGLSGALLDWIDTNGVQSADGAEDESYARREPAYRTAGTLLAEPSELRAMAGYTEELYQHLRPLVCALPTTEPSQINVNTLTEFEAPLLVMITGGALRLPEARRAIAARPAAGYQSVDEFLAQDLFAGIALEPPVRAQLGVRTRYFLAESDVRFHDARVTMASLMEVGGNGVVTTHLRRFGKLD